MRETWLRPNRRALALGCVPPLLGAALGAWLVVGLAEGAGNWVRWLGVALLLTGIFFVALLIRQLVRPRIAFHDGSVLFYLRAGAPIAVPLAVVESFFVGQGPATLPTGMPRRQQAANLVARLAQRETEWARREVKPALGRWCDGYVTISGTWCEPLDDAVLRRLNRRLHEVKKQMKQ